MFANLEGVLAAEPLNGALNKPCLLILSGDWVRVRESSICIRCKLIKKSEDLRMSGKSPGLLPVVTGFKFPLPFCFHSGVVITLFPLTHSHSAVYGRLRLGYNMYVYKHTHPLISKPNSSLKIYERKHSCENTAGGSSYDYG